MSTPLYICQVQDEPEGAFIATSLEQACGEIESLNGGNATGFENEDNGDVRIWWKGSCGERFYVYCKLSDGVVGVDRQYLIHVPALAKGRAA